jgi:hypothetical protein
LTCGGCYVCGLWCACIGIAVLYRNVRVVSTGADATIDEVGKFEAQLGTQLGTDLETCACIDEFWLRLMSTYCQLRSTQTITCLYICSDARIVLCLAVVFFKC